MEGFLALMPLKLHVRLIHLIKALDIGSLHIMASVYLSITATLVRLGYPSSL